MTLMTSEPGEHEGGDGVASTAQPRNVSPLMPMDNRMMFLLDCLLVIAALGSASWVVVRDPVGGDAECAGHITLANDTTQWPQVTETRQILYVDRDNTIHWHEGVWDGHGRLAAALRPAPEYVLLLVHPDATFETWTRTVRVLQHSGVQNVEIATCETTPFPSVAVDSDEDGRDDDAARTQ